MLQTSRPFRLALSLASAASLLAAPTAPIAQPIAGAATPDACARLGFPQARDDERYDRRAADSASTVKGRRLASKAQVPYAPPPPPPSVAPLPVPPVQGRLEQLVVTASGSTMLPGDVETERYPNATANPIRWVADDPVSTFSIDVDTAAYANVRRFLNDGRSPPADAVRVEELINYFDYGYPKPVTAAEPFRPFVAVAPSPWSSRRQLVHIGLQGYALPRASQPPLNLVFLIDTSGSMSSEDRLPLAKKALGVLIDQLGPQDRVAMVAYAGSAGAVLAPTSGREKLKMRCALGALGAGGSTAGGQGLALAYALARQNFDPKAVNRVILMTDGDFNVGVADPRKLKDFVADQRATGVYLSVYGFGRGNYNDAMMQTLSQNGNGTAGYVDTLSEARKIFRDDFASSVFPIADDVKIQVEFNPARVSEYRLIGYETRLLNREDFNNDRVDAGEVGSGASVTALYEITPAGAPASSDPLRYQPGRPPAAADPGSELAFLKVRYKLPGQPTSHLIQRAIGPADTAPSLAAAPESTRWAVAVAGFGQKLRGDPGLETRFGWRDLTALAQGARGDDPFGLRAEFVQLTRTAGETRRVNGIGRARPQTPCPAASSPQSGEKLERRV